MHATVVAVFDDGVTLDVDSAIACARCAAGKGCGAGFLARNRNQLVQARLLPGVRVHEGQHVHIELAAQNLLRAALLAYGVPLLGAIAGASIAWATGVGDVAAAIMAVVGIVAGLVVSRGRLRRESCLQRLTPVVTGPASAADLAA